jgi:hypothetical protein
MNNLDITSFTVIGTDTKQFTGTFNGNGKTITIDSISGDSYVGLFAYNTGTISNLTVTVTTVTGTGSYVGVIAGRNEGTITNCSVSATVSASSYAGGIAGDNWKTIQDCRSTGSVTTTGGINGGGITGENVEDNNDNTPQILRCFSSANVTVYSNNAGGIVGSHEKGIVENCYSTGEIKSNNTNAGGIAGGIIGESGDTTTTITKCYRSSKVSADTTGGNAGGIVGAHNGGIVEKCVALNTQIDGGVGENNFKRTYRIAGYQVASGADLADNYGRVGITGTNLGTDEKTGDGRNGQDVSSGNDAGQYGNQSFWSSAPLGWAFGTDNSAPWQFSEVNNLPKLHFEEE